jgi:hypothetical protein
MAERFRKAEVADTLLRGLVEWLAPKTIKACPVVALNAQAWFPLFLLWSLAARTLARTVLGRPLWSCGTASSPGPLHSTRGRGAGSILQDLTCLEGLSSGKKG